MNTTGPLTSPTPVVSLAAYKQEKIDASCKEHDQFLDAIKKNQELHSRLNRERKLHNNYVLKAYKIKK